MREIQFATPAPPGTVRVVFLGESAIQGFPQPLPLTNGSFLEAMLRDAWQGERDVEVLAKRRAAENELSDGLVRSRLIDRLPEIAAALPKPEELRQVTVNGDGASALTGLVAQLMHAVTANGKG